MLKRGWSPKEKGKGKGRGKGKGKRRVQFRGRKVIRTLHMLEDGDCVDPGEEWEDPDEMCQECEDYDWSWYGYEDDGTSYPDGNYPDQADWDPTEPNYVIDVSSSPETQGSIASATAKQAALEQAASPEVTATATDGPISPIDCWAVSP